MSQPTSPIINKVCMVGATGVGKTSVVCRYLSGTFDDAYATTIGVTIHTMDLPLEHRPMRLMIWDLEGHHDLRERYTQDYMHGAKGLVVVVDTTRAETLDIARSLHDIATVTVGPIPFVALLNKHDLASKREVADHEVRDLASEGWCLYETSAKTGKNIPQAFAALVDGMLNDGRRQRGSILGGISTPRP